MQADASGAVVTSSDNPMNHVSNPLEGIQVHALDFLTCQAPSYQTQAYAGPLPKNQRGSLLTTMEW